MAALLSAFEGLSPTAPAVHAQTPRQEGLGGQQEDSRRETVNASDLAML